MAAIPSIFILVLGIVFGLPDEYNIGVMILESLRPVVCDGGQDPMSACNTLKSMIFLLVWGARVAIVVDLVYIYSQIKRGKWV